ncbi:MAG: M23 family metallopeptidase [Trueperaceae bacterium]
MNQRAPRTTTWLWAPLLALSLLFVVGAGAARAQSVQEKLRAAQALLLPRAVAALAGVQTWESGYAMPVEGRLSSPFGWRNISVNGNRFHGGVDFAASPGTRVVAARSGRVIRAGWWGTYGYVVVLDHGDGTETRYAHLSTYSVAAGDMVRQGDTLGGVGSTGASTGPHLHFEIRLGGSAVDPLPYLHGER